MKSKSGLGLALTLILSLSACSKNQASAPIVSAVKTTTGPSKPSIAPNEKSELEVMKTEGDSNAKSIDIVSEKKKADVPQISTVEVPTVNAQITVNKEALFGQEFFYGADLQYSSIYDKRLDLYNQSSAFGHIPVVFRKKGNELQLVADNRRLFPSDVNHPERLISRYQIISETETTMTISEANSSEFLVTTIDPKESSPRDHWTRSFEFVADGNYLLQETSIVLRDGTIAEIMESVFPRKNLAVSSSFEKFEMDPTDMVGAQEGPAARYRFLPGESIYNGQSDPMNGELKVAYAQHFDIGDNKTIDWYVTPNINDEQMDVVKAAVEGWNRYFKSFDGIKREVLQFKGRLPKGIKVGDPRFNVINWDSRLIAGAAYESQANDPFTGKQSHSVIYMPVAWFTIGMKYWTSGQYSETEPTTKNTKQLMGLFKKSCMRDIRGAAEALNSARLKEDEVLTFSVQLMKQTLFHEVGHALGLAHNFKGSLSYDREDPKSIFATSIMDYNDYEVERQAFSSTTTSDGPLLEYDRQALSALYNNMKDVKSSDAVVPVCNDYESDTEDYGQVDPLCIRYDIEKDPTLSVVTAQKRLSEATLKGDVSLAQAIENVKTSVLSEAALKASDDEDKQIDLAINYMNSLYGVMRFYILGGKASLAKVVKTNLKSLYIFERDILPKTYSEKEMRERAFAGVKGALEMKELSPAVKAAIEKAAQEGAALLLTTPFAKKEAQMAVMISMTVQNKVKALVARAATDSTAGLVKLRVTILDAIAYTEGLPFFFGKVGESAYDFETAMISMLFSTAMDLASPKIERLHAANSLGTYRGRPGADDLIAKVRTQAETELKAATSNAEREFAIALKEVLIQR